MNTRIFDNSSFYAVLVIAIFIFFIIYTAIRSIKISNRQVPFTQNLETEINSKNDTGNNNSQSEIPKELKCDTCGQNISMKDVFCGSCGVKLQS